VMKDHVRDALARTVPELREEGLLDRAYVYGFDEVKEDKIPFIREVFGEIHRRWPGLRTMTTAMDPSFGRRTGLRQYVDIWCPLTSNYDLHEARKLRAEGKEVWWYVCNVPTHPYANWFIEYPAIEARLLMGAMSHAYEADGFLYYMMNKWRGNTGPVKGGPYVDWVTGSTGDPTKREVANGDGILLYPGPDVPLSTIRLENIRDGLEDYDYLYKLAELNKKIRSLPQTPQRQAYLEHCELVLSVPSSIVKNLLEYTRDPQRLYAWRAAMAGAIEQAERLAAN